MDLSVEARYLEPELPEELDASYRRTFDRLRGHFRMRGISPEEAADLAQEAAIRAMMHVRRRGVTAENLAPLMNHIARNLLIDRHRRGGPILVNIDDADATEDPALDPTEVVVSLEAARAVREAVGSLPDRHRDALLLAMAGMTPAQVAERMGIGRNAADALLHRARRSLKDRLKAVGHGALGLAGIAVLRAREATRRAGLRAGMIEAGSVGALQGSLGVAAAALVIAVNVGGMTSPAVAGQPVRSVAAAPVVLAGSATGGTVGDVVDRTSGTRLETGAFEAGMSGKPLAPGGAGTFDATVPGQGATPHKKIFGIDYEVYEDDGRHEGPTGQQMDEASRALCGTSPESCEAMKQGIGDLG